MTQTVYLLILRAQAALGLGLALGLVAGIMTRGHYAGFALAIAVFVGVASLGLILPYLTPSWVVSPSRRAELAPLILAHVVLAALYCFVVLNTIVALIDIFPLAGQVGLSIIVLVLAASTACCCLGARLCLSQGQNAHVDAKNTVTDFVMPTARRADAFETDFDVEKARTAVSRAS